MEGPSLVILKEQAVKFVGKPVIAATGAARIDFDRITGQTLRRLDTWGKHFLMLFDDCYIRIHYLMFGNYYIDSRHDNPEKVAKLTLQFRNGEWNHYNCAVKINEGTDIDAVYDFRIDLMNDQWDPARARKTLEAHPGRLVSDALLDQQVFSGLGNIMKNEILFRTRIHPESRVGALPDKKLKELVAEARTYAFDFLHWKKEGTLKRHWQAHTKKICPRCDIPLIKRHTGVTPRRSFFCEQCQELYV
ncbi:DNA-formamidopyrimidine glycosylase family protein [Flaviaesturariibacter aridisoli]|uniref:Endonuclease n=1 Tax=Flaviaesturariibacter aridisoli TaxID=2545761 RepID=A0A4R4DTL5_9BACT|nr:DNA-formamidopyrimidine glycosylase family protein [Flaviaesturariibacter aridisoli]TCZ63398.1 endonuclease [Flaviaesturariibacter aridisoli]